MTDYEFFFKKTKESIEEYINNLTTLKFKGVNFKSTKSPEYKEFLKSLSLTDSGKIDKFTVQHMNNSFDNYSFEFWFSEELGDGNHSIYSVKIAEDYNGLIELRDHPFPKSEQDYYTVTPFALYRYYYTLNSSSTIALSDSESIDDILRKIKANYFIYKDYLEECRYLMESGEAFKVFKDVLSCDPLIIGGYSSHYFVFLDLINSIAVTETLTQRRMSLKEFWILYAWKYDCLKSFGYTECRKLIHQIKKVSIPDPEGFWKSVDALVEERGNKFKKTKDLYIKAQKLFAKEFLELKGSIAAKFGIDPSWLGERKYDPDTGEVIIPRNLPLDLSIPAKKKNLKDRETFKGMLEIIEKLEKELKDE